MCGWQFRWPSLTYGKVHGMHALPGMELTGADPALFGELGPAARCVRVTPGRAEIA